jgi:uncharacterized protein (DUF1778 family)
MPDKPVDTTKRPTRWNLDADRWRAFLAALDAPPRELPRIARLFRDSGPFDDAHVPTAP